MTISDNAKSLLVRGIEMCFPEYRGRVDIDKFLEYCGPAFEDAARSAEAAAYVRVDGEVRKRLEAAERQLADIEEILR